MSATFPKNLWTSADLALLPDNGNRYEIIDGELLVTRAPHWQHQTICGNFYSQLQAWSQATGLGRACMGVGVIFSDSNDVRLAKHGKIYGLD